MDVCGDIMENAEDYRFVYTLSDVEHLVSLTIKSIKTLRKFVDKSNIIVFCTPPMTDRSISRLSNLAIVEQVHNLTTPFSVADHKVGRYGEKLRICDVDCETVFFLDCDTTIKKNPLKLLEGDFDFSARARFTRYAQEVEKMFKRYNKEPISIPNTGVMIFKNFLHRKIRSEWLSLINQDLLPFDDYAKEEVSLALCVSGKKIKWLTPIEHSFRGSVEDTNNTIILHGRKPRSRIYYYVRELMPRIKNRTILGI
jgi:hypothetical protein